MFESLHPVAGGDRHVPLRGVGPFSLSGGRVACQVTGPKRLGQRPQPCWRNRPAG